MTHFLRDILRQPKELRRTIVFFFGGGRPPLDVAAAAVRADRHVYLTGTGSSWHVSLSAGTLFSLGASPVYMQDAAELLEYAMFPPDATVIVISRSGRSIEIVKLLAKLHESRATVIGITNSADGPLASEAQIPLVIPVEPDHAISVNTYSTLALAAGILASAVGGALDQKLGAVLLAAFEKTESAIGGGGAEVADTPWFAHGGATYLPPRRCSAGGCVEDPLLLV